ncbi:MAG TPA: hypothetical protein VFC60_02570 [Tissierellaceae bacterium]|nr:hypothetical protein [Tissierellaceae bacterium]
MPKLSKIRLTGCKYDGLRKEHENSIFDLSKGETPDHSLFTLENGGGKGVMMQLIFQLLLPETKWGKNNGNQVISMFYDIRKNLHPFTFHVVLEWVLDTIPEKRLITGIAVKSIIKNTSTDDEEKTGLSYFLYTYEHHNNGYYTVENLPLYDKKNKEAVQLEDFDDFLNDNKRDFIKYSQSSGKRRDSDYYRYLQSRGIYRNEWLTLKKINKSEGGISDYFSNASDNKSIFDKVIIPAISENIRNYSSDDGNNLIEMFKSNLSITKDLPILLKRENDFRELILSIDPLIENAESGVRCMDRRQSLIHKGNDILYILNGEIRTVIHEIEKLRDSHEKAEKDKAELNFKKDNLIYNRERNDYLVKEDQVESFAKEYESRNNSLKDKEEELTLYNINKILYHKKAMEEKIKNTELEKEVLIKTLDIEDIREKAEELDCELDLEWENTREKWKRDEIEYHGYINYTNGIIEEEKNKKGKYKEKREELENEINKFEIEKEILKNKKKKLEKDYDAMSLGFPERILEDLNLSRKEYENRLIQLNSEKESIEKRISRVNEEINKEKYILSEKKIEYNKLEEKIEQQEIKELELARNISKLLLENYDGSVLDKSWFFRKLEILEDLINTKKKTLEKLQRNIWEKSIHKSLNIEDYFIPNKDVLFLKNEIEKWDIHVETGTEYLMNLKEDEKEKLLQNNSGFIYSLVISSERDWNIIQKNMNKDILLNNMVPIFIRSEMSKGLVSNFNYISSKADRLIDREIYNDWKYGLEVDFNKLSSVKSNIIEDIKNIEETREDIKLLNKGELVFELDKKLKNLESLILKHSDTIIDYEQELSSFKNKLNINTDNIEKNKGIFDDLNEEIRLMEDYINYLQEMKEKEILINGVIEELKKVKGYILDIDDNIEEIRDRQDATKDSYYKWQISIESLIKRVKAIYKETFYEVNIDKDYKTFSIPDFSIVADDFILILGEREAIERDINSNNAKLAVLDNDLKHYNEDLDRYRIDLKDIRENWNEYKDLALPLIEIDIIIKELNKNIKEIKKVMGAIKSNMDNLKGRLSALKKNLDNMESDILRVHKKVPIVLDIEDVLMELNNVNEELKSKKSFIEVCVTKLEEYKEIKNKLELNLSKVRHNPELDFAKGKMDKNLKDEILSDLDLVVDNWMEDLGTNQAHINKTKAEGESFRIRFLKGIELKLEEDKLKEKLSTVVREANLNNFRSNRDSFKSMKNHFSQELISLSKDKGKAEEAMRQWTNRAAIYVIKMIDTLKDMVSSMNYVNENQHIFPLVKLKGGERLPKEEDEVRYLLKEHFIQSISKVLEENENIENLDNKFIDSLMGDNVIFSKALQGRYPVLLVYKMTENNEFRYAKAREEHYATWEAINKGEGISTEGSGGQTLSVTTFVTMMIMSFKKKHIGNENPSTILLLDNPFGQASGKHVLDPIFEIADKLNFQLICFAAPEIIKVEISERFPIFWELRIEDGKVIHGGRIIKD